MDKFGTERLNKKDGNKYKFLKLISLKFTFVEEIEKGDDPARSCILF